MASVVVVGAGMCGSLAAMLLAKDGHDVVVLERDPAPPPATADEAWDDWERRGVRQFHMGHFFLPRFHQELQREFPEILKTLRAAGAFAFNTIADMPEEISGGWRDGDERFTGLTGRRPMVEAILGEALDASSATVRRGVAAKRLVTSGSDPVDIIGVECEAGETFLADLVVDAGGRQSAMPRLLAEAGGASPVEDGEDCGYIYYGRTFRSEDGSLPSSFGGGVQHYESISTLTLTADNGTWFCGIVSSAVDKAARKLRDVDVFEKVWRGYPLVAHWHDGIPLDEVKTMAGLDDRIRHYCTDDGPVATGLAALGDAWACTNPSVGRGASVGLVHAVELRDHLRDNSTDDRIGFAQTWHERTEASVRKWYDDTLISDRARLAEIDAQIAGTEYVADDPLSEAFYAGSSAMMHDPELVRPYLDIFMLYRTKSEVFADDELRQRFVSSASDEPAPGLTRSELVALLGG
jgi:2-polyprenyl-6-methoxyphenol hydroxylase-like FAD-dependent oxidoreductase